MHPKAIRAEAVYLFENPESGETKELAGRALEQAGFTFTLPKRQGATWFYRVKQGIDRWHACWRTRYQTAASKSK